MFQSLFQYLFIILGATNSNLDGSFPYLRMFSYYLGCVLTFYISIPFSLINVWASLRIPLTSCTWPWAASCYLLVMLPLLNSTLRSLLCADLKVIVSLYKNDTNSSFIAGYYMWSLKTHAFANAIGPSYWCTSYF